MQALQDDLIPLAQPITTASGAIVNELEVTKGTAITIPIHCVNRALSIWGEDAKRFMPERWLVPGGVPQRAKEFPGFHHTLTFLEGPRMCLGRGFALIEIKVGVGLCCSSSPASDLTIFLMECRLFSLC